MDTTKIEEMVIAIISEADYDLSKELDPDTAEEPEFAESFLATLVSIAERYING